VKSLVSEKFAQRLTLNPRPLNLDPIVSEANQLMNQVCGRSSAMYGLENPCPGSAGKFVVRLSDAAFDSNHGPLGFRYFKQGQKVFDGGPIRELNLNAL
jgi:hypothetical protein